MQPAVARRSAPLHTPLRRGTAVLAVTGGAFSLVAAGSPVVDAGTPIAPVAYSAPLPAQVGPTLLPSVEPVAPTPDVIDAGELVKAVQLAEQETARVAAAEEQAEQAKAAAAKKAAEVRAAAAKTVSVGSSGCGIDTAGLGPVKAHVRTAAEFLGCLFGEPTMHGVAGRGGTSDHPSGKAIDFMVDRATGDRLAACALRNRAALGITYVIWRQRIDTGSDWKPMEDRGGATANHMDHVHSSFGSGAGSGGLKSC